MPLAGRCLFLIAITVAWVFGGGHAIAAPGAGETCMACHADTAAKNEQGKSLGVDAAAVKASVHGEMQLGCAMCHADAAPGKTAHPGKLKPVDCSGCHDKAASQYRGTAHGKARADGKTLAASCTDCHGAHDIRGKDDPASRVNRARVPETCGACHGDILARFVGGKHGSLRQQGMSAAPGCIDCHTAHDIQRHDLPRFQLDAIKQCGTCHQDLIDSYRDTFHGKVTNLGYTAVATCSACHGAHEMLPASDPASKISPANRLATCQACHPGASASFASWDPHANKHDRARSPLYWTTARFMEILLAGVFAFFGIHTVFWFYRSLRVRLAGRRHGEKR